jgi:hypothetical protein
MTPAENPSATDKNLVLVCLVKYASAPPIPVESPAKRVNPKANQKLPRSNSARRLQYKIEPEISRHYHDRLCVSPICQKPMNILLYPTGYPSQDPCRYSFKRHSASHSGQASSMGVLYWSMHSSHSMSTLGTSPKFFLISSAERWLTALQPHLGQDV